VRGRRAPIFVGIGVAVLALLFIVFLVLPKLGQVSDAQEQLDQARNTQQTLQSRLAALKAARDEAPANEATIRRINNQVPLTADLPGVILLLRNAATNAGVQVLSLTPAPPALDDTGDFSRISVSSSGQGSYFAVVDYLFSIETLPRAATVQSIDLSPVEGAGLSFTASLTLYTSDLSAGPGSEPGPTETVVTPGA
jgi:Tfp pilus assembly protein PilO